MEFVLCFPCIFLANTADKKSLFHCVLWLVMLQFLIKVLANWLDFFFSFSCLHLLLACLVVFCSLHQIFPLSWLKGLNQIFQGFGVVKISIIIVCCFSTCCNSFLLYYYFLKFVYWYYQLKHTHRHISKPKQSSILHRWNNGTMQVSKWQTTCDSLSWQAGGEW